MLKFLSSKFRNLGNYYNCFKLAFDSKFQAYFPDEITGSIKLPICFQSIRSEAIIVERYKYEVLLRRTCRILIDNYCSIHSNNIIDIGAHIGDNSLVWGLLCKTYQGKVLAIDPSKRNIYWIKRLSIFNSINNVIPIQALASAEAGEKYYLDLGWIHHGSFTSNNSNNKQVEFTTTTLDDIRNRYLSNPVFFLHLDVEGMEYNVLKGSLNILKNDSPFVVFEFHLGENEFQFSNIKQLLYTYNYSIYMINEVLPKCKLNCRNFLAIPGHLDIDLSVLNSQINSLNYSSRYGATVYPATISNDALIHI